MKRLIYLVFLLMFISCGGGGSNQVAAPTFDPEAGDFTTAISVGITSETDGASIYYTLDGSNPTSGSTLYVDKVSITEATTLKAIAIKAGKENSDISTAIYTITPEGQVVIPVLNPASSSFSASLSVNISTSTKGATIYYTTDGTDPDSSSTEYTEEIALTNTTTIKAIAIKAGMVDSYVATETYTKRVSKPTIRPDAGSYDSYQEVTISTRTTDATIYYTIDGSTPTTSSTEYVGPFDVERTTTVKAIAVKAGIQNSEVATNEYQLNLVPTFAKTVVSGSPSSFFYGVLASDDSVYSVGKVTGNTLTDFGGTATTEAGYADGPNAVIVKYDLDGAGVWAQSAGGVSVEESVLNEVAIGSTGVYAAGYIEGNEEYSIAGENVTADYADGDNIFFVKFSEDGEATCARTVNGGAGTSVLSSISTYLDEVYSVGYVTGTGVFNFGDSSLGPPVTVNPSWASKNAVIVRYDGDDADCPPNWADNAVGTEDSEFYSVSASSNNICAVGFIKPNTEYTFGPMSTPVEGSGGTAFSAVVVKYNQNGAVYWAKSVDCSGDDCESRFYDVKMADDGVYAVGYIKGNAVYDFGGDAQVNGGYVDGRSVVIVKYDADGNGLWAKSVTGGEADSEYLGVSVGSDGIYVSGSINGVEIFNFGNDVFAQGSGNTNAVVVRYNINGDTEVARSVVGDVTIATKYYGISASNDLVYTTGYMAGTNVNIYDFGNDITAFLPFDALSFGVLLLGYTP